MLICLFRKNDGKIALSLLSFTNATTGIVTYVTMPVVALVKLSRESAILPSFLRNKQININASRSASSCTTRLLANCILDKHGYMYICVMSGHFDLVILYTRYHKPGDPSTSHIIVQLQVLQLQQSDSHFILSSLTVSTVPLRLGKLSSIICKDT